MIRGITALVLLLAPSGAHAWEASCRLTSATIEASFRGLETSSRGSSDASRADGAERAAQAGSMGSQCVTDDDCSGYCDAGTCLDGAAPAQQTTAVQRSLPGCADDQQCARGYVCREQRCTQSSQPPLQQPVMDPQCASDLQCTQGQRCVNGQCLTPPPPPPPSSSLQRRGSELYLRERAVQLRQDLALGEGPVIATLASSQGLSAARLGRAMRSRRGELVAMMGDGSDPSWPARFLVEVEAWCVPSLRVSSR